MFEVLIILSALAFAITGVAIARRKERMLQAALKDGDIETIHRLCWREARAHSRTATVENAKLAEALTKRLTALPVGSLIKLGEGALKSSHSFASPVFAIVHDRLTELRAHLQIEEEKRIAWPDLCDFFLQDERRREHQASDSTKRSL